MSQTTYTEDERRCFDRYCTALMHIVDMEAPGGFSGIVARGNKGDCVQCSSPMPAGIPEQCAGTDRVVCPHCVAARRLDKKLNDRLNGIDDELSDTQKSNALRSMARIAHRTVP